MTIYDIAKEAGVSPATVSRVLTGNARVSAEKRERVEELLEKYQFRPNELARSLVKSKTKLIGLMMADVQNEYYSALFSSCARAAEDRGYSVMVANAFSDRASEYEILTRFEEQQVEAIVIVGGTIDRDEPVPEFVDRLKMINEKIPVLTLARIKGCSCPSVYIDDESAMREIVEHLAKMGNHRAAIIGGNQLVRSTREKCRYFRQYAGKYGFEIHDDYFDNWSDYSIEGGFTATEAFFEKLKKSGTPVPDALIAISDMTAAGVMHSCRMHSIRIPEDLSLVSFDNTSFSRVLYPPLSSVDYGYEMFGRKVIDSAVRLIEGGAVPQVQKIETHLIVRLSSGYLRGEQKKLA